MSRDSRPRSVARKTRLFSVPGSPFNAVKFELAVVAVASVALAASVIRLDVTPLTQLLALAAIGVGGGGWIVMRTRKVERDWRRRQKEADSPAPDREEN